MVKKYVKNFPIEQWIFERTRRHKLSVRNKGELLCVENGGSSVLLGGASEVLYDNTVSVGQLQRNHRPEFGAGAAKFYGKAVRTARIQG